MTKKSDWTDIAGKPDEPERIGPYRILKRIGEGGMSLVYLAEQREPVRRRVALKVMKPGVDTEQMLARFDQERQALSLLPAFHEYRQSAAFTDMLRRAKIVDYWDAHGWPRQCRVLAGDDFECD